MEFIFLLIVFLLSIKFLGGLFKFLCKAAMAVLSLILSLLTFPLLLFVGFVLVVLMILF